MALKRDTSGATLSFKSNFLAVTLHRPDIRLFKTQVSPQTVGECFHSLHEHISYFLCCSRIEMSVRNLVCFTAKCFIHVDVILMVYECKHHEKNLHCFYNNIDCFSLEFIKLLARDKLHLHDVISMV